MRCLSCDKPLNNREATRKGVYSGEFIDLCDGCFSHIKDMCPVIETKQEEDDIQEEM